MRLPTHWLTLLESEAIEAFSEEARRAVYECIALRRDVRHFRADVDVDGELLDRVLGAAHAAPSVGFSQPWGFVVVRDRDVRERIRACFLRCREAEAARFPPARREAYLAHKLEGILEAPINLVVAVDLRDRGEAILGTTAQPEAVRASVCCAVQNLWLAARAEGIGVGWVSIVEPAVLRHELALPAGVEPVAYLCLGKPVAFRRRPMLEETSWKERRPLADVVHAHGRWEENAAAQPAKAPSPAAPEWLAEPALVAPDESARRAAQDYCAKLCKPARSLGRLEDLFVDYAAMCARFPPPPVGRAVLAVFAADHGVVEEGVSAYGSQSTARVVANVMSGGAAVVAMARDAGIDIALTDVGIAGDLSAAPTAPVVALRRSATRAGTANMVRDSAMGRDDAARALAIGAEVARDAARAGAGAIGLGEIGIGNTTAAAALTSVFTGLDPAEVVGRGTGIDDAVLARKIAVVRAALARHDPKAAHPLRALSLVGGLEIAALVGCALEAARHHLPVMLDGFVTNAAALVAARLEPAVAGYFVASHCSPEPGARAALSYLGRGPLFELGLRLGEGTGAVLGLSLLRTAVHTGLSMATFATAGIVGRAGIGS
jgi:nicotinate-nucleotide--dimethylbenzimidazole phosphoribosyltransferase